MGVKELAKVHVAEVVGVDDEAVVSVSHEVAVGVNGAGGAEEPRLESLDDVELACLVDAVDVGADLVAEMVGVDEDLSQAGFGKSVEPVVEEGTSGDGEEALGHRVSQGAQTSAQASGEEEDLHLSVALRRPRAAVGHGMTSLGARLHPGKEKSEKASMLSTDEDKRWARVKPGAEVRQGKHAVHRFPIAAKPPPTGKRDPERKSMVSTDSHRWTQMRRRKGFGLKPRGH
jgi:hypothetical protein